MKYLVSTKESQGHRHNDFSYVPEGEQVHPTFQCSRGSTDDNCGCRRSMGGVRTTSATTTFKVAEAPIGEVLAGLHQAYVSEGWYKPGGLYVGDIEHDAQLTAEERAKLSAFSADGIDRVVLREAKRLARQLTDISVGTICEYRGGKVIARWSVSEPVRA